MAAIASGLAFSTIGLEGVNLALTQTVNTTSAIGSGYTPEYPGPTFSLGQVCRAVDDSEYVFVKAASALAVGQVVYLDTSWNATLITSANAAGISGQLVAVNSQATFASGDYGWVQKSGLCPAIQVAASTSANAQLYTSSIAGQLTSTATSNVALNGIIVTTAGGGSAGNVPGLLNNPEVLLTT